MGRKRMKEEEAKFLLERVGAMNLEGLQQELKEKFGSERPLSAIVAWYVALKNKSASNQTKQTS